MANKEEILIVAKGQDDASPVMDKAAKSIKNFDKSMKDTQRGFRLMRGGAAQLSMQVQDVAVQLQGGTNVMTVFAQQGSQIASLFGAGGAFIGALLAVGAAIGQTLLPRLFESTDAAKELQEAFSGLSKILKEDVETGTFRVTNSFRKLAKESQQLAEIQLRGAYVNALNAANVAQDAFVESLEELVAANRAARTSGSGQTDQFNRFNRELGVSIPNLRELRRRIEAVQLGQDGAKDSLIAFINTITAEEGAIDKLTPKFISLISKTLEFASQNKLATETADELKRVLADLPGVLDATSDASLDVADKQKAFRESLQKQLETLGMSKQQLLEYQAKELELAQDTSILEKIQAIIDKQAELDEQKGIEKLQKSLMTKEEALKASYDKELALLESFGAKSVENAELVADLKIKAEERFLNKMEDLRKRSNDFEKKTLQEKTEFVLDDLGGMFQGVKAQNRKMFAVQKAYNIAQTIVETFAGAQKAATAYAAFPPLAAAMAAAHVAAGMARVAAIKSQSFEGGGFTGMGSRSGGVDGKGGFPAILHPNETVIDHTKGQGQGITIINNIDATGASGDVDLKIRAAMQETSQQTIATVQDLMRRRRFA